MKDKMLVGSGTKSLPKYSYCYELNDGSLLTVGSSERGWVCPLCGKANAPWKPECDCHKSSTYTTTTGTGGDTE